MGCIRPSPFNLSTYNDDPPQYAWGPTNKVDKKSKYSSKRQIQRQTRYYRIQERFPILFLFLSPKIEGNRIQGIGLGQIRIQRAKKKKQIRKVSTVRRERDSNMKQATRRKMTHKRLWYTSICSIFFISAIWERNQHPISSDRAFLDLQAPPLTIHAEERFLEDKEKYIYTFFQSSIHYAF